MEELNKDYTSVEQSKKLLELGVPANSANMYWTEPVSDISWPRVLTNTYETEETIKKVVHNAKIVPCWTTGRLMEIIGKARTDMSATTFVSTEVSNMLTQSIGRLEALVLNHGIDFNRLEEKV